MRTTAHAPKASIGDALGLMFFLGTGAAVLLEVTGVDPLEMDPQVVPVVGPVARVIAQAWGG